MWPILQSSHLIVTREHPEPWHSAPSGVKGKFSEGGKVIFPDFFPGMKYFFPVENFQFGWSKILFSPFSPFFPCFSFPGRSAEIYRSEVGGPTCYATAIALCRWFHSKTCQPETGISEFHVTCWVDKTQQEDGSRPNPFALVVSDSVCWGCYFFFHFFPSITNIVNGWTISKICHRALWENWRLHSLSLLLRSPFDVSPL